jgi:hypothetical protein
MKSAAQSMDFFGALFGLVTMRGKKICKMIYRLDQSGSPHPVNVKEDPIPKGNMFVDMSFINSECLLWSFPFRNIRPVIEQPVGKIARFNPTDPFGAVEKYTETPRQRLIEIMDSPQIFTLSDIPIGLGRPCPFNAFSDG